MKIFLLRAVLVKALLLFPLIGWTCDHLTYGLPKASLFIECYEGYAIGYNTSIKSLEWVSYTLNKQVGSGVQSMQASLADYKGSGYHRGHMANAESQDSSKRMMRESFYLINMIPHVPKHNIGIWKGLENTERRIADHRGQVIVFAGPLYEHRPVKMIGNRVPVPSHLWKIIYDPERMEAITFIIEHKPLKTSQLSRYIRSIDEVELRTGIDFLEVLPETTQELIEAKIQPTAWRQ